jgi:hypothetical protein
VVYAGRVSFAFNADLVSNLPGDISAIYVDPNAPAGQVTAIPTLNALTIPGSAPQKLRPGPGSITTRLANTIRSTRTSC